MNDFKVSYDECELQNIWRTVAFEQITLINSCDA